MLLTPPEYGKLFLQDLAILFLPPIPLNLHPKKEKKKKRQNYSAGKSSITMFKRYSILSKNPSKDHLFNAKRNYICQDTLNFQGKSSKKTPNFKTHPFVSQSLWWSSWINIFLRILQPKLKVSWPTPEVNCDPHPGNCAALGALVESATYMLKADIFRIPINPNFKITNIYSSLHFLTRTPIYAVAVA